MNNCQSGISIFFLNVISNSPFYRKNFIMMLNLGMKFFAKFSKILRVFLISLRLGPEQGSPRFMTQFWIKITNGNYARFPYLVNFMVSVISRIYFTIL